MTERLALDAADHAGPLRRVAVAGYGAAISVLLIAGVAVGLDASLTLSATLRAALAVLCLSAATILTRRTLRIALSLLLSAAAGVSLTSGLSSDEVQHALGSWTEIAVLLAVVPIVSALLVRRRYIEIVIAAAKRVGALATQLAVLISGHVIGSVALLAVVPVLGDFLGLRSQAPAIRQHFAQLILRGFVSSVAWSPSTGAMGVIVLATGLRWTQLAPALLLVGGSGLLLGVLWTMSVHRRSEVSMELSDEGLLNLSADRASDRSRVLELVGFLTVTFVLILVLELQDFATTVIVVPSVMLTTTLSLLLLTEGPRIEATTVRDHLLVRMPRGAGEAAFLLAAGFLGSVLAASGLSEVAVGRTLNLAGSIGISLQVVLPLLVVAVTLMGVPPLVSVALISGAIPLALTGMSPTLYAALLVIGSGTSLLIAPLTPTMLMVANYAGISPKRTGVDANRLFAPVYLIVLVAAANGITALLG